MLHLKSGYFKKRNRRNVVLRKAHIVTYFIQIKHLVNVTFTMVIKVVYVFVKIIMTVFFEDQMHVCRHITKTRPCNT